MSMTNGGWAKRSFIKGIKLWPPASILAPSLLLRSWMASETELTF
jgi:hypothetical protein